MSEEEDRLLREAAADQEHIVRTLTRDLEESSMRYLHGEIDFADLTFEMFETLQAIHAVRAGAYTIEYIEAEEDDEEDDLEELTQEPPRERPPRPRGGRHPH